MLQCLTTFNEILWKWMKLDNICIHFIHSEWSIAYPFSYHSDFYTTNWSLFPCFCLRQKNNQCNLNWNVNCLSEAFFSLNACNPFINNFVLITIGSWLEIPSLTSIPYECQLGFMPTQIVSNQFLDPFSANKSW